MWAATVESEAVLKALKTGSENSKVIKTLSSRILQTTSPGKFVTTADSSVIDQVIDHEKERSQTTFF
jgi:hypothetical protein